MVSFDPNILALSAPEDGQTHLIGSKCGNCGAVFFPQVSLCTECFKEGILKVYPLSTKGKLYAFTIVERESLAPKGFKVPYAYGYVELPEGVRVVAKIIEWTYETLKLDAPVEFVLDPLRENDLGQKVMGYRFKLA